MRSYFNGWRHWRSWVFSFAYEKSSILYFKYAVEHRTPWQITRVDLKAHEETTLGGQLYAFLTAHGFELQPRAENHDVFHVLTGIEPSVEGEIELSCFLFGNGKRSFYTMMVLVVGSLFFIDRWIYFWKAFIKGLRCCSFHDWDFEILMNESILDLQKKINLNLNTKGK